MTEKSRRILNELLREHSSKYARPDGLSDEEYKSIDKYNNHQDEICDFLNSIPEIESRLCKGGYIQDSIGTPCCDGDRVTFAINGAKFVGTLKWIFDCKCFEIVCDYSGYPKRFIYTDFPKWFEKIEE